MNYDINFRFLTRTFSEDYRVFYRKGDRLVTLSDLVEFAPLRTKVNIIYEHKPYAAIFEECGKIFLVVSGISNRYYVEHILLPAMILGENGHHLETINRILKEKGNLFINLYEKLNSDVPNYKCPYSAEQFSVECSRIEDMSRR